MLNMNEWMKLWGLDPKTGLPVLWKLWWPWLDANQPVFRMQVRVGSVPAPVVPAPAAAKVLKQAEPVAAPETASPTAAVASKAAAKTPAKKATAKKPAAAKAVATETSTAPAAKAKRITAKAAADSRVTAKSAEKPAAKAANAAVKKATPAAKTAEKNTTKANTAVAATAPVSTALSAATQQQIDQLGATPNKEALRAAIRAVYAEKGAATAEQWGKWLHQNADVLNTLHLQPMVATGEIKLQAAPAANKAAE